MTRTKKKDWQQINADFLSDRLTWLRQRLLKHTERLRSTPTPQRKKQNLSDVAANPQDDDSDSEAPNAWDGELSQAPTLVFLSVLMGLSPFEENVLLFCAAMELDPSMGSLSIQAHDDSSKHLPTFGLCLSLFSGGSWQALAPSSPLRHNRLVTIHQSATTPLISAGLRADERIVNFIKGLNHLDDRLSVLLQPLETDLDIQELPTSQSAAVDEILQAVVTGNAIGNGSAPVIQLLGSDHRCKKQVAAVVCRQLNCVPYVLTSDLIPSDIHELEELLRLWQRENLLQRVVLYLDASNADNRAFQPASALMRFVNRTQSLVLFDVEQSQQAIQRPTEIVDVSKPTAVEQRQLWIQQLGTDQESLAGELAAQFSFDAASLVRIARRSGSQHSNECFSGGLNPIWQSCRRHSRPRLDHLAQRIDCRATWDDLVLPREQTQQLQEIVGQVKHRATVYQDWGFAERLNRGMGISVLFAGESGTGKTMAAEVIANAMNLDLYRIDLSQVVNKYIGETEKNLKRVFDAADDGGAILFFDEADSLFGKRTDVKDSHDRNANIETNYLLQRMEAFRGLAILATNLKQTIDKAFLRRLRFVIEFPLPDASQRREMWRRAFPASTPMGQIDLEQLSRLSVTGGNIHTIALNAAFAAADVSPAVAMPTILRVAKAEFKKLQKPITASDFRGAELEGSFR